MGNPFDCIPEENELEDAIEEINKLEQQLKTKQRKIKYQQQIIENLKTEIVDQKALVKSLKECNK